MWSVMWYLYEEKRVFSAIVYKHYALQQKLARRAHVCVCHAGV